MIAYHWHYFLMYMLTIWTLITLLILFYHLSFPYVECLVSFHLSGIYNADFFLHEKI